MLDQQEAFQRGKEAWVHMIVSLLKMGNLERIRRFDHLISETPVWPTAAPMRVYQVVSMEGPGRKG
jgi:hypothetical protein